jgi:hypothetical protein
MSPSGLVELASSGLAGPHTVAGPCRILTGFRNVPPAVLLRIVGFSVEQRGALVKERFGLGSGFHSL